MNTRTIDLRDENGDSVNALITHTHPDGKTSAEFSSAKRIAGSFARIGGPPTGKIIITVDYDSGVTLNEVSGDATVACFYYENLKVVCESYRKRYPEIPLVIAAGGALASSERAKELVCAAAVNSCCAVAHAPGQRTFAEAFATGGPDALLDALSSATPPDELVLTASRPAPPETVPFSSPVDGAGLLRLVREHFALHTALSQLQVLAVSLWVIASWIPELFTIAPLLALLSVTRRCGKTSFIAAMAALLRRPMVASDVTAAALQESSHRGEIPVLDELDQYLDRHKGLVAVLNAGHSRDAASIRRKGVSYDVFGFKALGAIGELPPATIDRAIVISFVRKGEDVKVTRYVPKTGDDGCALHAMIRRFWLDNAARLNENDLPEPDVESDRAKDNWRPLLATARLFGPAVLEEALEAAKELTRNEDDNPHVVEEFIFDVVRIFVEDGSEFIASETLIQALCKDRESPWPTYSRGKQLSFRDLAKLMRLAKVKVGEQRNAGGVNQRGYWRRDLQFLIDGYAGRSR